ncbi:MAG: LON peptidase substrate-binding domain-containing protein [Actinomycetes bacterium]|jgi:ATP-dependent Lon protease
MDGATLPMFPLGSVLFPYAVLPLHVFEPRYRELVEAALASDACFGVVLIERGSEVGGGDTRFSVGTVARIVQARPSPDGRWWLATVGTQRIRVEEWLPDDPYPRARVVTLDDAAGDVGPDGVDGVLAEVRTRLRRVHALRSELGLPALDGDPPIAADPVRASFEAAALAPLGPLDAQGLLEFDDAVSRLAHLRDALDAEIEVCTFRLSG